MLLESLYRLNIADLQVRHLDPFLRTVVGAGLLVAIQVDFTIPPDHAFILGNIWSRAWPGAAQTVVVDGFVVLVVDPTGLQQVRFHSNVAASGAATAIDFKWSGEIIVPSSWTIRAVGNFSAAGASNRVDLAVIGLLIPRGNIERA